MQSSLQAPRLSTLVFLSALAILPINFFLPSLPGMAMEFGADYGVATLSLAAYAGISACLQLVLGPLSDRFGRRPVILGALTIFIVASIGCAMATDAWSFLACRMVQAVIAPTYAVSLAVIRDTTGKENAAGRFAYLAMAWAVAPMLGPTIGGLLDQFFGWRASFLVLAFLGLAVFVLCWADLRETNDTPSNSIVGQFRAYPELVSSKRFWAYCLCAAFSVGAFYAFLAGAPLAASPYDLSPAVLGLFMGSITGGFILGSFTAGRLAGSYAAATTLVAGRAVACGGLLLGVVLYIAGIDHVLALFGPCLFVGFSNGLTQPSASAGAISVRPALAGSAAGLASAVTVAGASIVAAVAGAVVDGQSPRLGLFSVMLSSAIIALSAAVVAHRLENASNGS